MQGKGLLLRGSCSIMNSHGEQVHVNESFVMWFNTITLKQFITLYGTISPQKYNLQNKPMFVTLTNCPPEPVFLFLPDLPQDFFVLFLLALPSCEIHVFPLLYGHAILFSQKSPYFKCLDLFFISSSQVFCNKLTNFMKPICICSPHIFWFAMFLGSFKHFLKLFGFNKINHSN